MQEHREHETFFSRFVSYIVRRASARRSFELPADVARSSKLLVIGSGELTDLLFVAPVVNDLQARFPDMRSTVLVSGAEAPVAREIMKVKVLLTYDSGQLHFFKADYWALVRRLRQERFEAALLLSKRFSLERHLLAFACGAVVRIGFAHPLAFPFINCELRFPGELYEGRKVSGILEAIGLGADRTTGSIALPQPMVNHARQLIHFRKPEKDTLTVGIDPSAGKTRHKVIAETVAYLANSLAGRRKVKFLILTHPWDGQLAAALSRELKAEVLDLIPGNAGETIALLSQCDLFIAGNTDLFHFAAALRVPTVGLFTKYDGSSWIPVPAPTVRIFRGTQGAKLSLASFFAQVEEVLAQREGVSV